MHFRHKPIQRQNITKQQPPPAVKTVKQFVGRAANYHKKIDEAINMISLNASALHTLWHSQLALQYDKSVHIIQDNFFITTKIVLVSKVLRNLFSRNKLSLTSAVIYTTLFIAIIFTETSISVQ
jgi:hypothetical protein